MKIKREDLDRILEGVIISQDVLLNEIEVDKNETIKQLKMRGMEIEEPDYLTMALRAKAVGDSYSHESDNVRNYRIAIGYYEKHIAQLEKQIKEKKL